MNRLARKSALAAVLVVVTVGFLYRVLSRRDPEGFSKRNPGAMHAHQSDWPAKCQPGKSQLQSPIHLTTTRMEERSQSPLKVETLQATADLIDVGHTFQIRYSAEHPGALAKFEGGTFYLRQFHFHKPSEHIVDGKQYEMEAHFVFLNAGHGAKPKALVLGVMILDGPHHPELAKIWKHLPPYREGYGETQHELADWNSAVETRELELDHLDHHEKLLAKDLAFDVSKLLPLRSDFIVYEGSLTTPSCDEGIAHAVSLTPMYMEHEQVEHFEGYYEGSNRDIQPIGDIKMRKLRRASTK